jgi:hypothetical protein
MTKLTSLAVAALCAAPTVAMIQPAQAGAAESHELAMQYIQMNEIVSNKLQQLSDSMGEPFAEYAAIELASCLIMKDNILRELAQETGLSDADLQKMKDSQAACQSRNEPYISTILETNTDDMPLTVQAALIILNAGARPEDAEDADLVAKCCIVLLARDFEITALLLNSINDAKSADDVDNIIDMLDTHATVLYTHLKSIAPDMVEELVNMAGDSIQAITESLKTLKKANYYGNATLREYAQSRLD